MNQVSWKTHIENCCAVHGCQYDQKDDCPIVVNEEVQEKVCDQCSIKGIRNVSHLHRVMGGLETIQRYKVQVNMNPNDEYPFNPYHWTLLTFDGMDWLSVAGGYEDSSYRAFEKAEKKHREYLEKEQKEFLEGEE